MDDLKAKGRLEVIGPLSGGGIVLLRVWPDAERKGRSFDLRLDRGAAHELADFLAKAWGGKVKWKE